MENEIKITEKEKKVISKSDAISMCMKAVLEMTNEELELFLCDFHGTQSNQAFEIIDFKPQA